MDHAAAAAATASAAGAFPTRPIRTGKVCPAHGDASRNFRLSAELVGRSVVAEMSPPLAALVAALAIGAGPAPGSTVKLAAPGLSLVDVDRARGTFFLEYFCEQLSHQGPIRITTEAEVAALVG